MEAADEDPHPPGDEALWSESWYFDFVSADAGTAGFVRLAVAADGTRSWWTYLVVPGGEVLEVRDEQLPPAAGGGDVWRVEARGLAAFLRRAPAAAGWEVGASADGRPAARIAGEPVGDGVRPIKLSLCVEPAAAAYRYPFASPSRYEQACTVSGSIRVGTEEWPVDGHGERDHSWGVRDWWRFPWTWAAGRLSDGTFFHGAGSQVRGRALWSAGFVAGTDGTIVPIGRFGEERAPGLAMSAVPPPTSTLTLDALQIEVVPGLYAALPMRSAEGASGRLVRALCKFRAGHLSGAGWCEWNEPRVRATEDGGV